MTEIYNSAITEDTIQQHRKWLQNDRRGEGRIEIEGQRFIRSRLGAEEFTSASFINCEFIDAQMPSVVLEDAIIEKTSLVKINWLMAHLDRISLKNCDISFGKLGTADASNAKVHSCSFDSAELTRSTWNNSIFEDVNFANAQCQELEAENARFVRCDFREVNLSDAILRGATFIECDLREAILPANVNTVAKFESCKTGDENTDDFLSRERSQDLAKKKRELHEGKIYAALKGKEPYSSERFSEIHQPLNITMPNALVKYYAEMEYHYYVKNPEIMTLAELKKIAFDMDLWG